MNSNRRDLVLLVADRNMKATFEGLLRRHQALEIRAIDYEIYSHPGHDGGCRTQGHVFLRTFCNQYEHAFVVFDHEGSGSEDRSTEELEQEMGQQLKQNGWDDRAAALVLDPELEIWVWGNSPHVDNILGWGRRIPSLRQWLTVEQFLESPDSKPERPKEAFLHALKHMRKPPSSSLFLQMASQVSFRKCADRTFLKLKQQLRAWFPAQH